MRSILVLLAVSGLLPAQASQNSSAPMFVVEDAPSHFAGCDALPPGVKIACASYNELLTANDEGLVQSLGSQASDSKRAYVCFRSGEDAFSVVRWSEPPSHEFRKVSTIRREAKGMVVYEQFEKGQSETTKFVQGKWVKYGDQSAIFNSEGNADVVIDGSEISIGYRFLNVNGGNTYYTILIRRSTERATESFAWTDPADGNKSRPDRGEHDIENSCIDAEN